MTRYVLDASAVLASLLDEPGAERIDRIIEGALISAVNFAEIVGYLARRGTSSPRIRELLDSCSMDVVAVDVGLSIDAGLLRVTTERGGLSLGDRFCLALARREGAVAVTADRIWATVASDVGVTVEVIR